MRQRPRVDHIHLNMNVVPHAWDKPSVSSVPSALWCFRESLFTCCLMINCWWKLAEDAAIITSKGKLYSRCLVMNATNFPPSLAPPVSVLMMATPPFMARASKLPEEAARVIEGLRRGRVGFCGSSGKRSDSITFTPWLRSSSGDSNYLPVTPGKGGIQRKRAQENKRGKRGVMPNGPAGNLWRVYVFLPEQISISYSDDACFT